MDHHWIILRKPFSFLQTMHQNAPNQSKFYIISWLIKLLAFLEFEAEILFKNP